MHSRSLKVAAAATCASALALGTGLTTAEATKTVTFGSHITIKSHALTFSGKVTSSHPACASHRKVILYRKQSQVLGATNTNSSGNWKITVSGSAGISLGQFYAKVTKRSDGAAGTIYVCKAATSKTIPMTP
jgi:hypothetical protein